MRGMFHYLMKQSPRANNSQVKAVILIISNWKVYMRVNRIVESTIN